MIKKLDHLEKLKELETEMEQLREVIEFNNNKKIKKLGRPYKLNEPLTETMSFVLTKSQRTTLMNMLKEAGVDLSTFIRRLITKGE